MESKHTPGPWYVHDAVTHHYRTKEQIGTYDIRTAPHGCHDNSIWIGDVKPYGGDSFTDKETAKANAYLIAAAPDLLAVAADALDFIQTHNHYVATGIINKLKEAIDKAGQPITCENP